MAPGSGGRGVVLPEFDPDVPAVVLGGVAWDPGVNFPSVQTAAELARHRRTLYLYTEGRGSLRERALRAARDPQLLRPARIPVRRVDDRLWLGPIGGIFELIPLTTPAPTRALHTRRLSAAIQRWLEMLGARHCILVVYWWFAASVVRALPQACVRVYDVSDEHASYPGSRVPPSTVRRLEGDLLDTVDRSFVVSPSLLEDRAGPGRTISFLPNAFDARRFAELREAGLPPADVLDDIDGPIVGCVGALSERADWRLLETLAVRRPRWTFVLLGDGASSAPRALAELSNVRMLEPVPYASALGVIERFDVGIIPFLRTPFTLGNSFLKLLDYFALGMPVVATRTQATSAVAADDPRLVELPDGVDAWLAALDRAVAEPAGSPARRARRAYVAQRTVERRVRTLLSGGPAPASARA